MTYFGFLLVFILLPILVLLRGHLRRRPRGGRAEDGISRKALWLAVGIQIALALVYTTPWDNHLVATGVWSYDPDRVSGVILGYVPLEEYSFFVLETLLVGLWWRLLWHPLRASTAFHPSPRLRLWSAGALAALWVSSTALLLSNWKPGTYLSITLAWALLPVIVQLGYGADLLWHERRVIATVILSLGLYLSVTDTIAIRARIWAIDPAQSTGVFIGALPVEEAIFFFVTVILITFGLTLTLSRESRERFRLWLRSVRSEEQPGRTPAGD